MFRPRDRDASNVRYCCRGYIPVSGIVVEGILKVFMISIGKLKVVMFLWCETTESVARLLAFIFN